MLELGASLSFITLYVGINIDIILEHYSKSFSVFTLVGESILANRDFRDCPVSVNHKISMADLIELRMVNFDIILGMN